MSRKALIIEDDEAWQNVIRDPLESLGLTVAVAKSRTEAKQLLDLESYDIVIIDIMVDENELEIAKAKTAVLITYIRQHYPNTKCAILTSYGTIDFAIGAFRQLGVVDFFVKDPFNVIDFIRSIKELLALDLSTESTSQIKIPSSTTASILHNLELERRKTELITQMNNRRKESEEMLVTIRNKRIAAKGNKSDLDDDEWITKRRKLLDEKYRNALAKIDSINSLDETGSVQLWLEKECNGWLGFSAE